jgi:hypothetical protein
MSEFAQILKEAFVGDEPFRPETDRATAEASVRKFENRMRTFRRMTTLLVGGMFIVLVYCVVGFLRLPVDANVKTQLTYVGAFIWAGSGITIGKLWFAMMHNHVAVMKEMKRIELMMLEKRGGSE